jgi:hypothetical protein
MLVLMAMLVTSAIIILVGVLMDARPIGYRQLFIGLFLALLSLAPFSVVRGLAGMLFIRLLPDGISIMRITGRHLITWREINSILFWSGVRGKEVIEIRYDDHTLRIIGSVITKPANLYRHLKEAHAAAENVNSD